MPQRSFIVEVSTVAGFAALDWRFLLVVLVVLLGIVYGTYGLLAVLAGSLAGGGVAYFLAPQGRWKTAAGIAGALWVAAGTLRFVPAR